jgi:SAM-dependent methyltransferase
MYKQTPDQIREHYEIEKVIADRLRASTAEERKHLYTWAYDELFKKVPHHPLLHGEEDDERRRKIEKEIEALRPLVNEETIFIEIGPGDCAVSIKMAEFVKNAHAIDVSNEVIKISAAPDNFELNIFDGINIPRPPSSVDLAYSNQLMEHLHPEDSTRQLQSIYNVLKPGGRYFCVTPNRLSGPHDVSRNFDAVATGLHLREFTVSELDDMFSAIGFRKQCVYLRISRFNVSLPVLPFKMLEAFVGLLPNRVRRLLTFNRVVRFILGIKLLATK